MPRTVIIAEEPDDVDGAVYALRHAVADLIEYRHSRMSDRVVAERNSIHAAASALQGLIDDLQYSEAAE